MKSILFFTALVHSCFCFSNNFPISTISRRNLFVNTAKCMGVSTIFNKLPVYAETKEDNPPLTPEEMEEYKKLLIEAERIESVINANKKAFLRDIDNQFKNTTVPKK